MPARAWSRLYGPLFTGWRFTFIPAVVLTHSGHGWLGLTVLMSWGVALGGEWLRRRQTARDAVDRRRSLSIVVLSLVLLGFFPEEAPLGIVVWAGVGLAWGEVARFWRALPETAVEWGVFLAGGLLGGAGLFGPGSWLMALLLLPLWAHFGSK